MKGRSSDDALFFEVCQLLTAIESLWQNKVPSRRKLIIQVSSQWFSKFSNGTLYLLFRLLLPGLDHNRVFGIKERRLAQLTVHALGLEGSPRGDALLNWSDEDSPGYLQTEMSILIEHLLKNEGICREKPKMTVVQVDSLLTDLAETMNPSGKISSFHSTKKRASDILKSLFFSMTSSEVKWLCRIILKEFPESIDLDAKLIFDAFHGWMWKIYYNFKNLRKCCEGITELASRGYRQARLIEETEWLALTEEFSEPMLGAPIASMSCGRATCADRLLAQIDNKHCMIEAKHDGERIQAHLCANWPNQVRIFNKDGKDITGRTFGIHKWLVNSVKLGEVVKSAIVEGELLVYNEKHAMTESPSIVPSIRQQIDSQHLMIVLFDVLYLNNESFLCKPLHERKKHLDQIVQQIPTYIEISSYVLLDLSCDRKSILELEFEKSLRIGAEGLVIKDITSNYIPNNKGNWFKLKKDGIEGFGDTCDFMVVGVSYSEEHPTLLSEFVIGCLVNGFEVEEYERRPLVHLAFIVNCGLTRDELHLIQPFLKTTKHLQSLPYDLEYSNSIRHEFTIDYYLEKPFLVELSSDGFLKTSCGQWILRSPRIKRVIDTNNFESLNEILGQAVSFDRLQEMALEATVPTDKRIFLSEKLEFIRSFKITTTISEIGERRYESSRSKVFSEVHTNEKVGKLESSRSKRPHQKVKLTTEREGHLQNHSQQAIIRYYYIHNRLELSAYDIAMIEHNFKGLIPLYTLHAAKHIEQSFYIVFHSTQTEGIIAQNFPKWGVLVNM